MRMWRSTGGWGRSARPSSPTARRSSTTATPALATVDYGTALGVIRTAHEQGKRVHVLVDETRPLLQGPG